MATSSLQLTKEEKNYMRFSLLISKTSPQILRLYFDVIFPPPQLHQAINRNNKTILSLMKSRRINSAQKEILRRIPRTSWPSFPPLPSGSNATSSQDFDLTLMIILLRNIGGIPSPTNGWDQNPNPSEKTPGAYLARLKYYRNDMAHTTLSSIDDTDFKNRWTLVDEALTFFNNGTNVSEVKDILHYDLDEPTAKLKADLVRIEEEKKIALQQKEETEIEYSAYRQGHLPRNVAENIEKLIPIWTENDSCFYETQGAKTFYEKMVSNHFMVITGNSGSGKTALMRHTALMFQREGFEIVPVESPHKIIEYNNETNQIFIIDDVVGKYNVNQNLLDLWEKSDETVRQCMKTRKGTTKVICTLRRQVAQTKNLKICKSILNENIFELDNESSSLSEEDKRQMIIKHLKSKNIRRNITEDEMQTICTIEFAFPLLCQQFCSNEEKIENVRLFFQQPVKFWRTELDKMYCENKEAYCSLVVCMMYTINYGKLNTEVFDTDEIIPTNEMSKIMEACGLSRNTSRQIILDALKKMDSYILQEVNCFKFLHDSLLETVSFHFCSENVRAMLSLCDIAFIRDRVRGQKVSADDENIIILEDKDFNLPSERFHQELRQGKFFSVLMSKLIEDKNFVNHLLAHIEKLDDTFPNSLINTSSSERDSGILMSIKKSLQTEKKIAERAVNLVMYTVFDYRSKLIHWVVALRCTIFFQYLWDRIEEKDKKQLLSRDILFPVAKLLFPLAVLGGHIDIVKSLTSSGADVNCFSLSGQTPLLIAVDNSDYEIVKLLIGRGAKVNSMDLFGFRSPLGVAVDKGNLDIVRLLVQNNAHSDISQFNGFSSLYIALLKRDENILDLMFKDDLTKSRTHELVYKGDKSFALSSLKLSNVDTKTKHGCTVLHYAVQRGDIEILSALLEYFSPSNHNPKTKEIEKTLNTKKLKIINTADKLGLTPLHLAVIRNDIEATELLLSHKADVSMRDRFGRIALHYIQNSQIAELILTYSSKNKLTRSGRSAVKYSSVNYESTIETVEFSICDIDRRLTYVSALKNSILNMSNSSLFCNALNLRDEEGCTPLHTFVKNDSVQDNAERQEIFRVFLKKGANKCLRDNYGMLPINYRKNDSTEGFEALYLPNVYIENEKAVHYAFSHFCSFSVVIGVTLIVAITLNLAGHNFPNRDSNCSVEFLKNITEAHVLNVSVSRTNIDFIILIPYLFFIVFLIFVTNFITLKIDYSDVFVNYFIKGIKLLFLLSIFNWLVQTKYYKLLGRIEFLYIVKNILMILFIGIVCMFSRIYVKNVNYATHFLGALLLIMMCFGEIIYSLVVLTSFPSTDTWTTKLECKKTNEFLTTSNQTYCSNSLYNVTYSWSLNGDLYIDPTLSNVCAGSITYSEAILSHIVGHCIKVILLWLTSLFYLGGMKSFVFIDWIKSKYKMEKQKGYEVGFMFIIFLYLFLIPLFIFV